MTRDELIEAMARILIDLDPAYDGYHHLHIDAFSHKAAYILTTIEALGYVVMRQDGVDWLMGLGDDFKRPENTKGAFWWRSEFRRRAMIEAGKI